MSGYGAPMTEPTAPKKPDPQPSNAGIWIVGGAIVALLLAACWMSGVLEGIVDFFDSKVVVVVVD
jgi:hypothetical protein